METFISTATLWLICIVMLRNNDDKVQLAWFWCILIIILNYFLINNLWGLFIFDFL